MIARFRARWLEVNASYWFYPALFTLAAAFLSFLTVWFDRNGAADWMTRLDWVHAAQPAGARNVLNVIAGSMIGVASTVFSITIAAVVYASGNYGPRLLTNFMQDRGNQLSLASFIATFVYAVMVLRVVRDPGEGSAADPGFVPQLSLLVATLLMALSVAVLVYFLNHIPSSIRINSVLQGIGERLIGDVRARFPRECNTDNAQSLDLPDGSPVLADATGYIEIIHFGGLDDIARDEGCRIAMLHRPGDFVHPGVPLLLVGGCAVDDDLATRMRNCFSLGGLRSAEQDIEFLIDELVEIALRALSPGINDPFTAVTALHWLGAATAELALRDLREGPDRGDYDRDRIAPLRDDFDHFMRRGFGALRLSAASSPIAAAQFLHCLGNAAVKAASRSRRIRMRLEADHLIAQARDALTGPALEDLEARYHSCITAIERGTP